MRISKIVRLIPKKKIANLGQTFFILIGLFYVLFRFIGIPETKTYSDLNSQLKEEEERADVEERSPEDDPKDDSKDGVPKLVDDESDIPDFIDFKEELRKMVWNFDVRNKIDWHDWEQIKSDQAREGPGEHGIGYNPEDKDKGLEAELYRPNGYNGYISDKIALDRSISDIRHPGCQMKKYSSELPSVSVVIPFNNEHMSTLARSFMSIIKRSPKSLLKEVILVDDCSTRDHLKQPTLENYIKNITEAKDIVRVARMPERGGLIWARQFGAKRARGQVLIFLDSHIEVSYNWLPPLLEPIAENYKTAVCPFIDIIGMDEFEYRAQDEGARGSFDWSLHYKRLPLTKKDLENPTEPFESPVMAGGLFAISSKYFWELDGYDEGIMVWGGEQYELSFKVWQCGGRMFDAPCSRVGHVYRKFAAIDNKKFGNFITRNYKRVAEVWMDEYKEYLYNRYPVMRDLDAGDLSRQHAVRQKLDCKPFKWFMENVAFDQPIHYPAIEPPDYASGKIRNVEHQDLCLQYTDKIQVGRCLEKRVDGREQDFVLNWHKDIRVVDTLTCLDVPTGGDRAPVLTYPCHNFHGAQLWRYRLDTKNLVHEDKNRCLDMDPKTSEVFLSTCDPNNFRQKWMLTKINEKRLNEWSLDSI